VTTIDPKTKKKLIRKNVPYIEYERDGLPRAHTCTFKVDMMEYSSLEIMREKLLYAMENATGIEDP